MIPSRGVASGLAPTTLLRKLHWRMTRQHGSCEVLLLFATFLLARSNLPPTMKQHGVCLGKGDETLLMKCVFEMCVCVQMEYPYTSPYTSHNNNNNNNNNNTTGITQCNASKIVVVVVVAAAPKLLWMNQLPCFPLWAPSVRLLHWLQQLHDERPTLRHG